MFAKILPEQVFRYENANHLSKARKKVYTLLRTKSNFWLTALNLVAIM